MIADVPLDADAMTVEPFNPIAACIAVPDLDNALRIANSLHVGLAGYAFINSLAEVERIQRELEVGVLSINHFGTPDADTPFGGVKDSGIGREGGPTSLDAYLCRRPFCNTLASSEIFLSRAGTPPVPTRFESWSSMTTSVHLGYVLGGLPFAERFPAARQLGFDAVEYPFPDEVPAPVYSTLLEDNGLQQISIGAPACDYKRGEPGFSLTPALQAEFDRSIDTVIDYATRIGCRNVHVFAGRASRRRLA